MDTEVRFKYRGNDYVCQAFVDLSERPYYIFVVFEEPELVKEFGEEITIKTDLQTVLPRNNDYQALVEISQSIFRQIKMNILTEGLQPRPMQPNRHGLY